MKKDNVKVRANPGRPIISRDPSKLLSLEAGISLKQQIARRKRNNIATSAKQYYLHPCMHSAAHQAWMSGRHIQESSTPTVGNPRQSGQEIG